VSRTLKRNPRPTKPKAAPFAAQTLFLLGEIGGDAS
jgi:hypothetical protein